MKSFIEHVNKPIEQKDLTGLALSRKIASLRILAERYTTRNFIQTLLKEKTYIETPEDKAAYDLLIKKIRWLKAVRNNVCRIPILNK